MKKHGKHMEKPGKTWKKPERTERVDLRTSRFAGAKRVDGCPRKYTNNKQIPELDGWWALQRTPEATTKTPQSVPTLRSLTPGQVLRTLGWEHFGGSWSWLRAFSGVPTTHPTLGFVYYLYIF